MLDLGVSIGENSEVLFTMYGKKIDEKMSQRLKISLTPGTSSDYSVGHRDMLLPEKSYGLAPLPLGHMSLERVEDFVHPNLVYFWTIYFAVC